MVWKLLPKIVTIVPFPPPIGVIEVTVGTATCSKKTLSVDAVPRKETTTRKAPKGIDVAVDPK